VPRFLKFKIPGCTSRDQNGKEASAEATKSPDGLLPLRQPKKKASWPPRLAPSSHPATATEAGGGRGEWRGGGGGVGAGRAIEATGGGWEQNKRGYRRKPHPRLTDQSAGGGDSRGCSQISGKISGALSIYA
jgi:hypothetical protein